MAFRIVSDNQGLNIIVFHFPPNFWEELVKQIK